MWRIPPAVTRRRSLFDGGNWKVLKGKFVPAGPRPHTAAGHGLINEPRRWKQRKHTRLAGCHYYCGVDQPPSPRQREMSSLLVFSVLPATDPSRQTSWSPACCHKITLLLCFIPGLTHSWYGGPRLPLTHENIYETEIVGVKNIPLVTWKTVEIMRLNMDFLSHTFCHFISQFRFFSYLSLPHYFDILSPKLWLFLSKYQLNSS